jgi:hypothetical protein
MFGMLDYRAHKLYLILFGIPIFFLSLISVLGLPLLSYGLGIKFSEVRLLQILISLGAQFVLEILWTLILTGVIAKLFIFIFSLFIDVIPSDGRTPTQALQVVYSGTKAITLIDLDRIHPSLWSDELIASIPKMDWVMNLFYREVLILRFEMLRTHFTMHPNEPFSEYHVKQIVQKSSFPITLGEKVLTVVSYRRMALVYSFFLYLLLFKPF